MRWGFPRDGGLEWDGDTHLHQWDKGTDIPLRHLDFPDQFVLLCLGILAGILHLPREGPCRRQPPGPVFHRHIQV